MSRTVLKSKAVGETVKYEFNFLSLLAAGETISSETVSIAVYAGTDLVPADMLDGDPWSAGTSVYQRITAGEVGVIYEVTVTVVTSTAQTLTIVSYLAVLTPEGSDMSLECCPRIGNAASADGQAFSMTFAERPVTAYADGLQVFAIFDADVDTDAPTVNMDLLGAKTIKRSESLSIRAYEIKTDDVIHLVFDQDADCFIAMNTIPAEWFWIAQQDQDLVFTADTDVVVLAGMQGCTVLAVRAGLKNVSTAGVITFDLNDSATTMLSTKLTIDQDEATSLTAAAAAVISVRDHADGWTLKMDIDTAGTANSGWFVGLLLRRN